MVRLYVLKHTSREPEPYRQTYRQGHGAGFKEDPCRTGARQDVPHMTVSSEGMATKSLPRYRRVEAGPPLVLQGRDLALLEDVWRYRLLSTRQLETFLYFKG